LRGFTSLSEQISRVTGMCPLCHSPAVKVAFSQGKRNFLECSNCDLLYCEPNSVLSVEEERQRYLAHTNEATDLGYVAHLNKLILPLLALLSPNSRGVDYGCGHTPVLSTLLAEAGHQVTNFDPFFGFSIPAEPHQFDFIACTEAIEHFIEPRSELLRMHALLKPRGLLAIMTGLRDGERRGADWWYLRDITHRRFYSTQTFDYVAKWLLLETATLNGDVVIFRKLSAANS
jgi:hypothetical protein